MAKTRVFVKVTNVKENVMISSEMEPIRKEITTTTSLYMKQKGMPFKKISSATQKNLIMEKKTTAEKKVKSVKSEKNEKLNETDKLIIFYLLGMASMLGLFGFYKGISFLLSDDNGSFKGGYNKLPMDENKILLDIESKNTSASPEEKV